MYNLISKTITLNDGRTITIESGKLAKQADGSAVVKMGNTMLLATVCAAKEIKPDVDFMPLTVEYKEKFAAAGRFPGGFLKREGRASDYEILISRLVDRALRPLFPDNYHADVFVTINLISADVEILPDALAGLAASAALAVSDIPFHGPVSEVRVARVDGQLVINPFATDLEKSDMDIIVAATNDNIMMVEGEMSEVSESDLLEAIKYAHETIKQQCKALEELKTLAGKTQDRTYEDHLSDPELEKMVNDFCYQKLYNIVNQGITNKELRSEAFKAVKAEFIASLGEEHSYNLKLVDLFFHDAEKHAVRNFVLDTRKRLDGRGTEEIRPIWSEVDYLPAAHGSAIFTRGETQSLTSVTLGTKLDEKIIDDVLFRGTERFLLHYNFPPFATGEAKAPRGLSRREIGHGNLAHRALKRMIPGPEINPYVVRVVSDILESNGSSSMATVCAGTLALMDAGVQIERPVTGIAMGMISCNKTNRFAILSDILGEEDHLGDMDFKVCGTTKGITATQMDIKVDGLSYETLALALEQAKKGRLFIMDKISTTLAAPRSDYKPHTPRIVKMYIEKDQIGAVIGSGGKVIQDLQKRSDTIITIKEIGNQGEVEICGSNAASIEMAKSYIKALTTEPEIGAVFTGTVKNIQPFGAFVEFIPGVDGLCHISEIEWRRLEKVEEVLKVGDEIEVKLIGMDKGKYKLSRKVLLPKPEGFKEREPKDQKPQ